MKVAQRYILVLGVIVLLAFCTGLVYKETIDDIIGDWEIVYLERFMNKLCRNGSLSYEEYMTFWEAMNCTGNKVTVRIDEYIKEQDLERNYYYSPMVWEEIQGFLCKENSYDFTEGSVLKIEIHRWNKTQEKEIRKFGRISKGAEKNGT